MSEYNKTEAQQAMLDRFADLVADMNKPNNFPDYKPNTPPEQNDTQPLSGIKEDVEGNPFI